jgi:hypothetical protein
VILASTTNVSGSLGGTSAENLLDLACANGSELPGGISAPDAAGEKHFP